MSEPTDSELEALERQVQAAFRSTLPRTGFDRELWARIVPRRRWAWLTALLALPSRYPAQSLAGATLAVLLIGVGVVFASVPHGPGGAGYTSAPAAPGQPQSGAGSAPAKGTDVARQAQTPYEIVMPANAAAGLPGSATVFKYQQPDRAAADAFAASLGARARQVPSNDPMTVGIYDGPDFVLSVTRGSGDQEARYQIVTAGSGGAAGGDPKAVANAYLDQHGLLPSWPSNQVVSANGTTVNYLRRFDVSPGRTAAEFDSNGNVAGSITVEVTNGRVTVVNGPLPVSLSSSSYQLQGPAAAVAGRSQRGAMRLTVASMALVYMQYSAGPIGYYVPAYFLSGTTDRGEPVQLVVPAVDLQSLR